MRSLTRNEVTVVGSLLANEDVTQNERIKRSHLPRRTYEVARRRLIESGTVVERYVPNPSSLGIDTITLAVAYPYAERFPAVCRRWLETEGNVVLWRTQELLLGVFLSRRQAGRRPQESRFAPTSDYSRFVALEVETSQEAIPVYFDFEGEWARIADTVPRSYPQSICPTRGARPSATAPLGPRLLRAIEDAVAGTPQVFGESGRLELLATIGRRSALRKATAEGHLRRRAFLNPGAVPSYQGWTLGEIILSPWPAIACPVWSESASRPSGAVPRCPIPLRERRA